MNVKSKTLMLIFMSLWILTAGAGGAWAEDKTEALTINPVPIFSPDGSAVPGDVREGRIDEIQNKGVIIGDSYYPFSRSAVFLSSKRTPASKTDFDVSEKVGYRLNSKGEIVVMWIEDRTKAP